MKSAHLFHIVNFVNLFERKNTHTKRNVSPRSEARRGCQGTAIRGGTTAKRKQSPALGHRPLYKCVCTKASTQKCLYKCVYTNLPTKTCPHKYSSPTVSVHTHVRARAVDPRLRFCVHMSPHMAVRRFTHTSHACLYTRLSTCLQACLRHVYAHAALDPCRCLKRSHACVMCMHMSIHMSKHMCAYMYIHMSIHLLTHMPIHMCVYVPIPTSIQLSIELGLWFMTCVNKAVNHMGCSACDGGYSCKWRVVGGYEFFSLLLACVLGPCWT